MKNRYTEQLSIYPEGDVLTVKEAARWASEYLGKSVSESNISYLIQYGKIRKLGKNGSNNMVSKNDLIAYYKSYRGQREMNWKKVLGEDLNWHLSFDYLREKDTTKHVHRLHPYKGKFIPQLVEYFLDDHVDESKTQVYFRKGDIVLDPFCGSGTTMVQANELGIHCIGIDVSGFNALISNAKIAKYNLVDVTNEVNRVLCVLNNHAEKSKIPQYERELLDELFEFNNRFFPSPEFRYRVSQGDVSEVEYGNKKAEEFLPKYRNLVRKYRIELKQSTSESFLDKWFFPYTREEINLAFELIRGIKTPGTKKILSIILSRTIRSCRATTHSDLATLKRPQLTSYYCVKHKKICKPICSIRNKWETYGKDTIRRLAEFQRLRTNTHQYCLTGDSRTVDVFQELTKRRKSFAQLVKDQRIKGIFSSPPYVGLINYHEQHAYAYDLYGFETREELEIGPLYNGTGGEARKSYVEGIVAVLNNCKRWLADDYDVFLVANDKRNLYPTIAEKAGMRIVNRFKRPVLNRTERAKGAYSEIIFHLKED